MKTEVIALEIISLKTHNWYFYFVWRNLVGTSLKTQDENRFFVTSCIFIAQLEFFFRKEKLSIILTWSLKNISILMKKSSLKSVFFPWNLYEMKW